MTGNGARIFVAGATGYIGRTVVRELISRGHTVIAFARETAGVDAGLARTDIKRMLDGAEVRFGSVTDVGSIQRDGLRGEHFDVFVSCLASRTGGIEDSWQIEYAANASLLDAARSSGAASFVLLSAICVQNPQLAFQRAKLAFEEELAGSGLHHAIVRPTAFFKSLAGQVERIKAGKPFMLFGRDPGPACKPISEADLARFVADCVEQPQVLSGVLPIGGPGPAMTPLERGEMLFELLGQSPRFTRLPLALFDTMIPVLGAGSRVFPALRDKAEFARIGRFYATEPMLAIDPATGQYSDAATPSYGADSLREFYTHVIAHGLAGQELGDQALF